MSLERAKGKQSHCKWELPGLFVLNPNHLLGGFGEAIQTIPTET